MGLVVLVEMGKRKQEIIFPESLNCSEVISTTIFAVIYRKGRTAITCNRPSQLCRIINIAIDKHTVQRRTGNDNVINIRIKILIKRNDLFPILGKKISFYNLDLIAVNFKFDTLSVETGQNETDEHHEHRECGEHDEQIDPPCLTGNRIMK